MVERVNAWILQVAAVIGALIALFAFLRTTYRASRRLSEAISTLSDIATEFTANHGTSLRDVIDRIDSRTVVLQAVQRAILQNEVYAITETDQKGLLVWANRTFLTTVGLSLSDVKGRGWIRAIHGEDRARVVQEWNHTVADGRDSEITFCLSTPSGLPQPVHARCMTLRDTHDVVHGWLSTLRKITCEERDDLLCASCKYRPKG